MKLKSNTLKATLKQGHVAFGTCIYSFSPDLVELAGHCGLDFCRIDNEHAWRQDNSLENMMRAARLGDIVPLARVDRDNPYLIRKALEIGAGGVIIPQISTAEEARDVVKAAKFPPQGLRGFGNLNISGGLGTANSQEWIRWSNEETLVGIMIETCSAMDNIESIMAVEGIDYVLFGPADYSLSLGLPAPNVNDPRVQEAIRKTVQAANSHGKYVMIGVGYPWTEQAKKYIEMGCHMIELGHDYTILRDNWRHLVQELKVC